jgi:hypothetical protein
VGGKTSDSTTPAESVDPFRGGVVIEAPGYFAFWQPEQPPSKRLEISGRERPIGVVVLPQRTISAADRKRWNRVLATQRKLARRSARSLSVRRPDGQRAPSSRSTTTSVRRAACKARSTGGDDGPQPPGRRELHHRDLVLSLRGGRS